MIINIKNDLSRGGCRSFHKKTIIYADAGRRTAASRGTWQEKVENRRDEEKGRARNGFFFRRTFRALYLLGFT